jgi:hypothetical protein
MYVPEVERIDSPSPERLERCIAEHRPAILTGLMKDQKATRCWDLDYLRARLGRSKVQVVSHDKPRIYWNPDSGLALRPMTFDDFVDGALDNKNAYSYMQDDVNSFPVIKDDYRLPEMMSAKGIVRGKFWLSGAGLVTPLHYDAVETFHWVVRGSKRFMCFAPGVRRYYPFSWRTTAPFISQLDPDSYDRARFPRFADAQPVDLHVNEGEILYLPAFWWHQVYSEAPVNVSVNFVWWASRGKYARHLPQLARAARHLYARYSEARAKARGAAALPPAARPVSEEMS